MTADNAVVLIVVIAMFAVFMGVLGSVWIWSNLPEPAARKTAAPRAADTDKDDQRLAA